VIGGKQLRRLLLPCTEQWVYCVVRAKQQVVVVQTLWGARRGRGPKLCHRLRSAHSSGSLRLVTGYGQASDKARAIEAGSDAHLVKPVALQNLQRLLEGFRNESPPSERD
jgi:DNA-binding response OmpR family regulator